MLKGENKKEMPREWTPQQLSAMNTRDKTLLVSAAAGSGKTATLTERIIRSLLDEDNPADISRMIIVTFTRAAAAELRERISAAISQAVSENPRNRRLASQLLLLPSAKICTIDSFCSDILREHATRLGLSPAFRVCDENERALLMSDIMETLIEECYGICDNGLFSSTEFCRFADSIVSAKKGEGLSEALLGIYEKISSFTEKTLTLAKMRDNFLPFEDFFKTKAGEYIKSYAERGFAHYESLYSRYIDELCATGEQIFTERHLPAYDNDLRFARHMIETLKRGDYTKCKEELSKYSKVDFGSIKGVTDPTDERLKTIRSDFRDFREYVDGSFFSYTEGELVRLFTRVYEFNDIAYRFLYEYDLRFCREKKRRGICDYGDLEHYALALLYNGDGISDVAERIRDSYDYIYIDEYQDINPVQHAIFSAITRQNNCFMVGDIKQSIYSFRRADPDIFAAMKSSFPKLGSDGEGENASIFMSDNFRCDEPIIDFINAIFDVIFGVAGDSIGYERADRLNFKKQCRDGYAGVIPQFILLDKPPSKKRGAPDPDDEDEETAGVISEYEYVAKKIKALLSGGRLANGKRIKPSDIAILLRSAKTKAPRYAEALRACGIDCNNNESESFFSNPEILLVLCLLNTIDNPQKDIYLAGTLHSPIYNFSLDDLLKIRLSVKGKKSLYDALVEYCEANPDFERGAYFLSELARYREKARACPVDKLIRYLYNETGLLSMYGRASEAGHARLIYLYNHARGFEASSFKGLYNFVQYINEIIEKKRTFAEPSAESGAGVSIMTIHHSKGLEFPVCFVCDCGANMSSKDTQTDLLFDATMGVCPTFLEEDGVKVDNPVRFAMARRINDNSVREELRVLYVALTRAREQLYVVGRPRKMTEKLLEECEIGSATLSEFSVLHMNSYEKLILTSLLSGEGKEKAKMLFVDLQGNEMPLANARDMGIGAQKSPDTPERDAPSEDTEAIEAPEEKEPTLIPTPDPETEKFKQMIRERIEYSYPYAHLTKIPAKLSVSRLYPDILDTLDESAALDDGQGGIKPTRLVRAIPRFVLNETEADSAQRGTATHLFMQFADFATVKKNGAKAELERLVREGFITETDADITYENELLLFERSEFLSELLAADNLRREFRFNTLLSASDFTQSEGLKIELEGERLLVQGVIDCIVEHKDGSYSIVDYKTDRLTDAELADKSLAAKKLSLRHREQLRYYSYACEQIYGKKPKEALIYSLPLGDTVTVDLNIN